MNKIIITNNKTGEKIDDSFFLFPAGEVGIKLDARNLKFWWVPSKTPRSFTITAQIQNSNDTFRVLLVKDAIERLCLDKGYQKPLIDLVMPYVPYARQDRVCVAGESFSLRVFADIINGAKFNRVTVYDPHSNVVEAVFDNIRIISQLGIFQGNTDLNKAVLDNNFVFCSPDEGATKKTLSLAQYYMASSVAQARKVRNLSTGEIIATKVDHEDFNGRNVLIPDDICDGGRTFIEIAKILKKRNVGKLILYVTHGIFSKGVDVLFENGFDEIWTTDSYQDQPIGNYPADKVRIFKLGIK